MQQVSSTETTSPAAPCAYRVTYYDAKLSRKGQGVQVRTFTDATEAETFASANTLRAKPCRPVPVSGEQLRAEINRLGAELAQLVGFYDDGDRQDTELKSAIRDTKRRIRDREVLLSGGAS